MPWFSGSRDTVALDRSHLIAGQNSVNVHSTKQVVGEGAASRPNAWG